LKHWSGFKQLVAPLLQSQAAAAEIQQASWNRKSEGSCISSTKKGNLQPSSGFSIPLDERKQRV